MSSAAKLRLAWTDASPWTEISSSKEAKSGIHDTGMGTSRVPETSAPNPTLRLALVTVTSPPTTTADGIPPSHDTSSMEPSGFVPSIDRSTEPFKETSTEPPVWTVLWSSSQSSESESSESEEVLASVGPIQFVESPSDADTSVSKDWSTGNVPVGPSGAR